MNVSTAQAELCASFILDNCDESEIQALPGCMYNAMTLLVDHDGVAELSDPGYAQGVERVREAIERWMLIDRDACVAMLGPGLGLYQ